MASSIKNDKKTLGRRNFLKSAVITAGSAAGFLGTVKFDQTDGIKVGSSKVSFGVSEAHAICSYGSNCGGGGGTCSYGSSCGGGGGMCSYGSNCAGS